MKAAAKKTAKKTCDCRDQVDEQLKPFNTELEKVITMDFERKKMGVAIAISTVKIDPKKRAPAKTVMAAYCPFCGRKL